MKYLNQYHKESEQRKAKKLAEWLQNPIPASEALKQQSEIHKEIRRIYGNKNKNNNAEY
jgi:hypothetical protein